MNTETSNPGASQHSEWAEDVGDAPTGDVDQAGPAQPDSAGEGDTSATEDRTRPAPRFDRVQVVIVALIGLAMVFFVRGWTLGVTGEDRYDLGRDIESVSPTPDALQAGARESVFVDLAPGYTGVLTIDDVTLQTVEIGDVVVEPGTQVELPPATIFEPGNATLTFTPQAGSAFPDFAPGEHRVKVTYWLATEDPSRARTWEWEFNVS